MMIKLKFLLTLAIVAIAQSLSYSQVAGMPYILPTNNLTPVYFNYTGAIQTWTVPAGVFEILVDVTGAQGTSVGATIGGAGGRVRCRISVSPGQILYLTVGGQSTTNVAEYGFGGNGGYSTIYNTKAGAGGGLSAIATADPVTQANALVVAGGGGGGCTGYNPVAFGGAAGGLNGANGIGGFDQPNTGGRGATESASGAAGIPYDFNSTPPTAGAALRGGSGGVVGGASPGWNGGGGGGAGYFGGGGGAGGGAAQGGGGGGSSWIHPNYVSSVGAINLSNQNTSGHGSITIYY